MSQSHGQPMLRGVSARHDGGGAGMTSRFKRWVEALVGGPARFQIIFVLAAILALDAADKATISAVTGSIENVFHVGHAEIGLLIAVVSFMGAIGTIPAGVLVDKINRKRLLLFAIALWSAAEAVSGIAFSYWFLLITRLVLGAIVASAFPTVASLTGDFFPARDRARMYGLILGGELVGTGIGFFVAGELSSWFSWRVPFFVMAVIGAGVLVLVWRALPEPARGGQSWITEGQEDVRSKEDVEQGRKQQRDPAAGSAPQQAGATARAQQNVLRQGVQPRPDLVLKEDPASKGLWWAISYVVRVPTYLMLIIATSLAYFFFSGVRAFGMIYLTGHYDVSRSTVGALAMCIGLGALLGVVAGGRLSEWLLRKGYTSARIIVAGAALFLAVLLFGPAIWASVLWIGIPLLSAGAFMLAAANPPIDAARLDIMHPRLWGRAESGSMALRAMLEGGAPLLFGIVSEWLGGGVVGLKWTFLLFLVPLLIAAGLAIPARRTYPRDVATAAESVKRTASGKSGEA